MAQAKSVKYQWKCKETKQTQGIAKINRAKLKELPERAMYQPRLRKKTMHKAIEAKG